ncbi:hypothetical protein TrispH2_005234 [Trichoplax sp. H2]|nr:hypothetical protein TrispH2_005234 [Trichoplax sp. H2]|eukprot:RDD42826.1 hypothetical protein TrispH2_005234 [Trichoplax sp. H2]
MTNTFTYPALYLLRLICITKGPQFSHKIAVEKRIWHYNDDDNDSQQVEKQLIDASLDGNITNFNRRLSVIFIPGTSPSMEKITANRRNHVLAIM